VQSTVNDRPERGMLSSFITGLAALGADLPVADALLLSPVDFPAVAPSTVAALLDAVLETGSGVAVPSHDGRRGHPLALAGEAVAAIRTLDPEIGLRQLLQLHAYRTVAVDDPAIHLDFDTWRDHAVLTALLEGR
jgi:molybdenum cofactor cytidylyltransferase